MKFIVTNSRDFFSFHVPLQLENGEKMLGLASLEACNSFSKTRNKNYNSEVFSTIKKKKRYFSANLKCDVANFKPEGLGVDY